MNTAKHLALKSILASCLIVMGINLSYGASSVSYDPSDVYKYGVCTAQPTVKAANNCAEEACIKAGGNECEVLISCRRVGYGILAVGQDSIGASCGWNNPDKALAEAMERCNRYASQCQVAKVWNTTTANIPQAQPNVDSE